MTREVDTGALVTIVIPLYNGGAFIDDALRSVLAQTFERFEVIVVDDGSTDDGPDAVLSYDSDPRVQLIQNLHVGVAAARNLGASRASVSSRYVLFLDADDRWNPDALETMVNALDRRSDAAGSFVLAEYIDEHGEILHPGDFPRHMRGREELSDGRLALRDSGADVEFEHLFIANLVYPPSCLLVRRSAYESAGGFDGRFLAEDWEFVARLARQGPFVPVDRVLAGYRRHSENASRNRARNVRGARQVWAAVYHADDNSDETRVRLRAIWRAHQARTARRKLGEARALVGRGKIVAGVLRTADGITHALSRRPPRFWMAQGAKLRAREAQSSGILSKATLS